jgi:radical SAM superfamily enzyme YgiQ (UPF0313 family)
MPITGIVIWKKNSVLVLENRQTFLLLKILPNPMIAKRKTKVVNAPMSNEEREDHIKRAVSHCMGLLEAANLITGWKKAPAAWRRSRKIKSTEFDVALREHAFLWVGALAIEKPFLEMLVQMNHRNTPEWQRLKKVLPPDLKKLLKEITACGGANHLR